MKSSKKKVLIIEQNQSLGFVIKTVLDGSFQTITVTTPFDAMDILSENKIECIILGIDQNSNQSRYFLQHLKSSSLFRELPLIVLTDMEKSEFEGLLSNTGILKVFKKPFDPLKVLNAVTEMSESIRDAKIIFRRKSTLNLN